MYAALMGLEAHAVSGRMENKVALFTGGAALG